MVVTKAANTQYIPPPVSTSTLIPAMTNGTVANSTTPSVVATWDGSSPVAVDFIAFDDRKAVARTPRASISMANVWVLTPGASPNSDTTSTPAKSNTVVSPRSGRPGYFRMLSTLMETATNTRPASAADAPAAATKKSVHAATWYAGSGTARACQNSRRSDAGGRRRPG